MVNLNHINKLIKSTCVGPTKGLILDRRCITFAHSECFASARRSISGRQVEAARLAPIQDLRARGLCEGMSIRAVVRVTGFSKTTVSKLVVDAGQAAAWYQDRVFQSLKGSQCRPRQEGRWRGWRGVALARDRCGNKACSVLACRHARRRRRDGVH
jgi:hypothetical protein